MKNKGNIIISTTFALGIGASILGFVWTSIQKVDGKAEEAKAEIQKVAEVAKSEVQGVKDEMSGMKIDINQSVSNVKTDVEVIKTDVQWIRSALENSKNIK